MEPPYTYPNSYNSSPLISFLDCASNFVYLVKKNFSLLILNCMHLLNVPFFLPSLITHTRVNSEWFAIFLYLFWSLPFHYLFVILYLFSAADSIARPNRWSSLKKKTPPFNVSQKVAENLQYSGMREGKKYWSIYIFGIYILDSSSKHPNCPSYSYVFLLYIVICFWRSFFFFIIDPSLAHCLTVLLLDLLKGLARNFWLNVLGQFEFTVAMCGTIYTYSLPPPLICFSSTAERKTTLTNPYLDPFNLDQEVFRILADIRIATTLDPPLPDFPKCYWSIFLCLSACSNPSGVCSLSSSSFFLLFSLTRCLISCYCSLGCSRIQFCLWKIRYSLLIFRPFGILANFSQRWPSQRRVTPPFDGKESRRWCWEAITSIYSEFEGCGEVTKRGREEGRVPQRTETFPEEQTMFSPGWSDYGLFLSVCAENETTKIVPIPFPPFFFDPHQIAIQWNCKDLKHIITSPNYKRTVTQIKTKSSSTLKRTLQIWIHTKYHHPLKFRLSLKTLKILI